MKYIVVILSLVLLNSCVSHDYNAIEKVQNINGQNLVPYNGDFMSVDGSLKPKDFVFIACNTKEMCYHKEYLTIYKKDSSRGRYGNIYCKFRLSNKDNTVFISVSNYLQSNDSDRRILNLKVGDEVFSVWTKKGLQDIRLIK